MRKVLFPSVGSLAQVSKSASGGPPKTFAYPSCPPELASSPGYVKLRSKLEKILHERASLKTDLEMAVLSRFHDEPVIVRVCISRASLCNTELKKSNDHIRSLEETIRNREKELEERRLEKQETDQLYRTATLTEEIDANKMATESLNTKLGEVHLELKLKEEIRRLITAQENMEAEKLNLHLSKNDLVKRLDTSVLEMKNLEGFVHVLAAHLAELDRQSVNFLEKFDKLNSLYEACFQ